MATSPVLKLRNLFSRPARIWRLSVISWTAVLLILIIFLSATPALAQNPNDYDYRVQVTISNDTGATLTNALIPVPINAGNLVDNGFMQADGGDILFANESLGVEDGTAQDLTENPATWWIEVDSLPDEQSLNYFVHTGDATADRDQGFVFGGSESQYVSVPDHASLNLTDDLRLTAHVSDLAFPTAPTGDNYAGVWGFNECTGLPQDVSGNGNHATANTGDWATANSYNQKCSMQYIRSVTDYTQVPDASSLDFANGTTITIEFRIKPTSLSAGYLRTILYKGGWTGSTEVYNYWVFTESSGTGYLNFGYEDSGGTPHQWRSTNQMTANTSYHVAFIYTFGTASSLKLYVDGTEWTGSWIAGTGNGAGLVNAYPLEIGRDKRSASYGDYGEMILDELRIWRDARTVAELTAYDHKNMDDTNYGLLIGKIQKNTALTGAATGSYGLHLTSDGELGGRVLNNTLFEYNTAWTGTGGKLELTFENPNLKLFVDDVQQGTTQDTGFGAIKASSGAAVRIGDWLAGDMSQAIIKDDNTPAIVFQGDFEPDELAETQEGASGNGWTWTGTVEDQSASSNDGTYQLVQDMTDITVLVYGLQVKDTPASVVPDTSVLEVIGTMPEVWATPTPVSGFLIDPMKQAGEESGMPLDGFFLILGTMIGTPLVIIVYKKLPVHLIAAAIFLVLFSILATVGLITPYLLIPVGVWIVCSYLTWKLRNAQ